MTKKILRKPLSPESEKVVSFLKEAGWRIDPDNGEYNLRHPAEKYYVFCYWDGGSNGSYCSEKQAIDTAHDAATAEYDRQYKVLIYDVENDKEVNIKITISLE